MTQAGSTCAASRVPAGDRSTNDRQYQINDSRDQVHGKTDETGHSVSLNDRPGRSLTRLKRRMVSLFSAQVRLLRRRINRVGSITKAAIQPAAIIALSMRAGVLLTSARSFGERLLYSIRVISPGRQVWSNQGSSGPYSRRIVFQPLPGTVCSQLLSLPSGASGPK